jgi:hypothetical protein
MASPNHQESPHGDGLNRGLRRALMHQELRDAGKRIREINVQHSSFSLKMAEQEHLNGE